jgi:hypothetical protein
MKNDKTTKADPGSTPRGKFDTNRTRDAPTYNNVLAAK